MADETHLPERVVDEITTRLTALEQPDGGSTDGSTDGAGAAAGGPADDPDQQRRELEVDRAMATSHSRRAHEIVATDDSPLCRECHEARPCSTTTALAAKYALAD